MYADTPIRWTFGELDDVLSDIHNVMKGKGTAFQARLKNFNRLGIPVGLEMKKGKATQYGPGEIFEMALAVEFTQLGLSPERVVDLINNTWKRIVMAAAMAARDLVEKPRGYTEDSEDDPSATLIYFDPNGLRPLTGHNTKIPADIINDGAYNSFRYSGEALFRENIILLTSGSVSRLSVINITAMIDLLASAGNADFEDVEYRLHFFRQLLGWAEPIAKSVLDYEDGPRAELWSYFNDARVEDADEDRVDRLIELYAKGLGFPSGLVRRAINDYRTRPFGEYLSNSGVGRDGDS